MSIARKDWLEFVRDRRLLTLAVLALLIALAALATSYARVTAHEADRAAAQARDVETWNGQGARNPHSAAHFGEWAMRPLTPMALLDPGVTPYAGSAIWLEAHSWNPARNRPIEDQETAFDLGAFSVAWALQIVMPLIIFVLAAGLVARERERGTLRLLLAQGATPGRVLRGKAGSLLRITALLAVPVLLAALGAVLLAGTEDPLRLLLWCAAYLIYLTMLAAIALAVSVLAKNSARAMLVLAGFWLVAMLLVPRAGASLAEAAAPTPAADTFWAGYRAARDEGPAVFGEDAEAFTAETMRRYGVSRPEDLPVSIGGLQLEEDERLGNIEFDRLYGALADTYAEQRGLLRWSGFLSPLPAMQNLSATLAGTSMPDEIVFQRAAEEHRRRFVTYLNLDLVNNGAGEEFDYLAGDEVWRNTPRFDHQRQEIGASLRAVLPDALILLGWLAAALLLLRFAARRLAREAV